MRTSLLLLALGATGCIEPAHAQSAPRGDAGLRADARQDGSRPHADAAMGSSNPLFGQFNDSMIASLVGAERGAVLAPIPAGPGVADRSRDTLTGSGLRGTSTSATNTTQLTSLTGAGIGHSVGSAPGLAAVATPRSSGARVLRDSLSTSGTGLSPQVILRILRRNRAQIAECFDTAGRSRPLPPNTSVVTRFTVTDRARGTQSVVDVSVERGTPLLAACLRARLQAISFPSLENAENVSVVYTITLS
jgi:hypothetical protein